MVDASIRSIRLCDNGQVCGVRERGKPCRLAFFPSWDAERGAWSVERGWAVSAPLSRGGSLQRSLGLTLSPHLLHPRYRPGCRSP